MGYNQVKGTMKRFFIRVVDWAECGVSLLAIRHEVFVAEQQVPKELEVDGLDDQCVQVLAEDEAGAVIGTARLMPEGRVGRVAVLKAWRRYGVGAALVAELEEEARRQGMTSLELHSQTWTIPFYESIGFVATDDDEFIEAGIRHRLMEKKLG